MKKRLWTLVGSALGHLVLALLAVILVVYFLGVGQPGKAMMADLAREEITGTARVGHLHVDPLGGRAALIDLEVKTADGEPALSVGAVDVAAASLTESHFSRVAAQDVSLTLTQDDSGQWNLDGLMVEKPDTGPKESSPLQIDELSLERATVKVRLPDTEATVGPISIAGALDRPQGGAMGGHIDGRIDQLALTPLSPMGKGWLTGLTGSGDPLTLGPFSANVHWDENGVDIRSVEWLLGTLQFYLQGQIDLEALAGTLSLMATRDGKQVGSLLARRSNDDWAFSVQWSQLEFPGFSGDGVAMPALDLSGLTVSALPRQLSAKLNRFGIDDLPFDGGRIGGLSISGSLQFESTQRLDDLARGLEAGTATLADIVNAWQSGDAVFALIIEEIARGSQAIVAPLRLRVEVRRKEDQTLRANVSLALHPHGTITAELTADLRQREGRVPFVAQLHIDGLETTALLELLDVPGMLKGMVSGRLEGSLEVAGNDLASPTVKVPYCRFELSRKEGGDMVFRTPDNDQVWDLGAAPAFSFFSKELTFGDGKLIMEVVPQG